MTGKNLRFQWKAKNPRFHMKVETMVHMKALMMTRPQLMVNLLRIPLMLMPRLVLAVCSTNWWFSKPLLKEMNLLSCAHTRS